MKFKLSCLLIIILCITSLGLVGCGEDDKKQSISISTNSVTIRLEKGDDGEYISQTASFVVDTSALQGNEIGFRLENEGVISSNIKSSVIGDETRVTITAIKPGNDKVIVFSSNNSTISASVAVNVIQPIEYFEFLEGYTLYAPFNTLTEIKPTECMNFTEFGDTKDIVFSLYENVSNLEIEVSETGIIDTRGVTKSGKIVIQAKVKDLVDYLEVEVVCPVSKNDISITSSVGIGTDRLYDVIYENSEKIRDITLCKTYEYYCSAILDIAYATKIKNPSLKVFAKGGSVSYSVLNSNTVLIQSVDVGVTELTLSFNVRGAEDFIESVNLKFNVSVIEAPLDILINGEKAKDDESGFEYTVYNNYASSSAGTKLSFTLLPYNILPENAKIKLTFENDALKNYLYVTNSNFRRVGVSANGEAENELIISSNDVLYFTSIATNNIDKVKFTAEAVLSAEYSKAKFVKSSVTLNLREGIKSFTTDTQSVYLEKGTSETLFISTGSTLADISNVTYSYASGDVSIVTVQRTDDPKYLNFTLYGEDKGEAEVVFDSGNGFQITIYIKVYVKITSVNLYVDSPVSNSNIGNVLYDDNNKAYNGENNIKEVDVVALNQLPLHYELNDGASLYQIRYVVTSGSIYVALRNNDTNIDVIGVGEAIIVAYFLGYSTYGAITEVDSDEAFSVTFKVRGYRPIESVAINRTNVNLKDYTTVGYMNVAQYSQVNLKLNIYPTNATVNYDDIRWTFDNEGSLNKTTGKEVTYTAGPIREISVDKSIVNIYASLTYMGRTFTEVCQVTVERATMVSKIRLNNIYNNSIYFDSRKGLGGFDSKGNLIKSNQDFIVSAEGYAEIIELPVFNPKLRYEYVGDNVSPVFYVDNKGNITPLRGGKAKLMISADDSYLESGIPQTFRYVDVQVADGSVDNEYRLFTVQDLKDIGKNEETLKSHYVLGQDIEFNESSWTPIGSVNKPFTGSIKGYYVENGLKVSSKITGKINVIAQGSKDVYAGIFGVAVGSLHTTFDELMLELEEFNVNAKNISNANLYVGSICALLIYDNLQYVADEEELGFDAYHYEKNILAKDVRVKIINFDVQYGTSSNASNFSYIGGMFGKVEKASVSLIREKASIEVQNFNVTNFGDYAGELLVGGLAGVMQSCVYLVKTTVSNTSNESVIYNIVDGGWFANVVGNKSDIMDIQNSIIFDSELGYAESDASINQMTIKGTSSKAIVGGLIGKYYSEYEEVDSINIADDDYYDAIVAGGLSLATEEMPSYVYDINAVNNVIVSANINTNAEIVGGIVGESYNFINYATFMGSICGTNNIGGIVGVAHSLINNCKVLSSYEIEKEGYSLLSQQSNVDIDANIGGIVGSFSASVFNENHLIIIQINIHTGNGYNKSLMLNTNGVINSYVSSYRVKDEYNDNIALIKANKVTSKVGTIIGSARNMFIIQNCYSSIETMNNYFVGNSDNIAINNAFIIDGTFNSSNVKLSYYTLGDAVTYYNKNKVIDATLNKYTFMENGFKGAMPSSTIEINGNLYTIDGEINNGLPILINSYKVPIFDCVYEKMDIKFADGENFIKVNDDRAVLFYYAVENDAYNTLSSKEKVIVDNIVNMLNRVDLEKLLTYKTTPSTLSDLRLHVKCLDSTAINNSAIAYVDANGELVLRGTGLFYLQISSVTNPTLIITKEIYVTNYVADYGIYKSNVGNETYSIDNLLEIRKGSSVQVFATYNVKANGVQIDNASNLEEILEKIKFKTNENAGITYSYELGEKDKVSKTGIEKFILLDGQKINAEEITFANVEHISKVIYNGNEYKVSKSNGYEVVNIENVNYVVNHIENHTFININGTPTEVEYKIGFADANRDYYGNFSDSTIIGLKLKNSNKIYALYNEYIILNKPLIIGFDTQTYDGVQCEIGTLNDSYYIVINGETLKNNDEVVYFTFNSVPTHEFIQLEGNNTYCYTVDESFVTYNLEQFSINSSKWAYEISCVIEGVNYNGTVKNGQVILINENNSNMVIKSGDENFTYLNNVLVYNGKVYQVKINKAYTNILADKNTIFNTTDRLNKVINTRPYISAEFSDGKQNVYFDNGKMPYKNFGLNIYEGAMEISSNIGSAIYSPTDTINFQITMLSDAASDALQIKSIYNLITGNEDFDELDIYLTLLSKNMVGDGIYKSIYNVRIDLKDEFEFRYFSQNKKFQINFNSTLIGEIGISVNVEYEPQTIQQLKVENYTSGGVKSVNGEYIYNPNEAPSTFISPRNSGLIELNMYPAYSYVEAVSVGYENFENGSLYLEQMSFDENNNGFIRLTPRAQYLEDGSILLRKVSKVSTSRENEFNGTFYVKTQLSGNLEEGQKINIIVKAYSTINGEYQVVSEKTLVLTVKDIPNIQIALSDKSSILEEGEGDKKIYYIVKGTSTNFDIILNKVENFSEYKIVQTIDNKGKESDYNFGNNLALNSVEYIKGNSFKAEGTKITYTDSIYVGIGVQTGTEIKITASIEYLSEGETHILTSDIVFAVVDFILEDVDFYSINNVTNSLNMNVLESYEWGVKNIDFKVAPIFEIELQRNSLLTSDDKNFYDGYYYGKLKLGDKEYLELSKQTNGLYKLRNVDKYSTKYNYNIQELNDMSFDYDGAGVLRNVQTKKEIMESIKNACNVSIDVKNVFTFVDGVESKMNNVKNKYRYFSKSFIFGDLAPNIESFSSIMRNTSSEDAKFKFEEININDVTKSFLVGLATGTNYTIKFAMNYGYENYEFKVYLDKTPEDGGYYSYEETITVNVLRYSDEDLPLPIYTAEDFANMEANEHYILANNITLRNWVPIDLNVLTFDGNGYTINLQSFDVEQASNGLNVSLGLFNTISSQTLLKNLTLNIGGLSNFNLTNYSSVEIGLLAITNQGIITNCCIATDINVSVGGDNEKSLSIQTSNQINGQSVNVDVALFVLGNYGSITNSRVGYKNTGTSQESSKMSETILKVTSKGNISGFVSRNVGHIAACYASNIYLTNISEYATNGKTAGFVIENTGYISNSFVSGSEDKKLEKIGDIQYQIRSEKGGMSSNGSIGGFVYSNSGEIQDCFTNIDLSSNAKTAGFVLENAENGTIKTSYSASRIAVNSALHTPFIGVDNGGEFQNKNLNAFENCYYLVGDGEDYSSLSQIDGIEPINYIDFTKDELQFSGFSFSYDKGNFASSSIWKMADYGPMLVEPNNIAFSQRDIQIDEFGKYYYVYGKSEKLGSITNPYLLSSGEDFNNSFVNSDVNTAGINGNVADKYYRIVADIDFDDIAGEILTCGITLSGVTIEGNGFSINNAKILSNGTLSYAGLFAKINAITNKDGSIEKFSNVRNLTLNIKETNAISTSIVGGLAGIIENSNIFNVKINSDAVIQGYNAVGGLAGAILGESNILNIISTASVQAVYNSQDTKKPALYVSDLSNIKSISHVGAIAGIIDLKMNNELNEYTFSVANNANVKNIEVSGNVLIDGEYVGGLFGFVGPETHIYNSRFIMQYENSSATFNTSYAVGGLCGINFGLLNNCRIDYTNIDKEKFYKATNQYLATGEYKDMGNTNLYKGYMWYAGGLVGVNVGGTITDCYSFANIIDPNPNGDLLEVEEQYIGGLVGATYGGQIQRVYATGDILTKINNGYAYAGGVIGAVYNLYGYSTYEYSDKLSRSSIFSELYALNIWNNNKFNVQFRSGNVYGTDKTGLCTGLIYGFIGLTDNDLGANDKPGTEGYALSTGNYYISNMTIKNKTSNVMENMFTDLDTGSAESIIKWTKMSLYAKSILSTDLDIITPAVCYINYMLSGNSSTVASANSFFKSLTDISEVWGRDIDKFPHLMLGKVNFVVDIYTAQQLINETKKAPYKVFKIVNDLDFNNIDFTNGIIGNEVFTGKLISGKINEFDEIVKCNLFNIKFTPNPLQSIENYGFLSSAKRATFSDLNFFIIENNDSDNAVQNNKQIKRFGLICGRDEASGYSNVNVTILKDEITHIEGDNSATKLELGTLISSASYTGGYVGEGAGNISLTNCTFNGNFIVNRQGTASVTDIYVGGIAGKVVSLSMKNSNIAGDNLKLNIKMNEVSEVGLNQNGQMVTSYSLKKEVKIKNNATVNSGMSIVIKAINSNNLYMGGATGRNDTRLIATGVTIGSVNSKILLTNDKNAGKGTSSYVNVNELYAGGLVGYSSNGVERSVSINGDLVFGNTVKSYVGGMIGFGLNNIMTNIEIGNITKNSNGNISNNISNIALSNDQVEDVNVSHIGGIVGLSEISSINQESSSEITYSNVAINYIGNPSVDSVVYAGGIYGKYNNRISTGMINLHINMLAMGTMTIKNSSKTSVGGLVGANVLTEVTQQYTSTYSKINNAVSNVIINVDNSAIQAGNLFIGGIIGNGAEIYGETHENADFNGKIYLSNCIATNILDFNSNKTNIYAGGIVGNVSGEIKNCINASIMRTNSYAIDSNENVSHNFGKVVGTGNLNLIKEVKVITEFNVSQNMKSSEMYTTSKDVAINENKISYREFLNSLNNVDDYPLMQIVLNYNDNNGITGTIASPDLSNETNNLNFKNNKENYVYFVGFRNSENKDYYTLDTNKTLTVNAQQADTLNCIVIGNGIEVYATTNIYNKISPKALLSNFVIHAKNLNGTIHATIVANGGYAGLIANQNYGLIYNIFIKDGNLNYVDNSSINTVGSIVGLNSGVIASIMLDHTFTATGNTSMVGYLVGKCSAGVIYNVLALGEFNATVLNAGAIPDVNNSYIKMVNIATSLLNYSTNVYGFNSIISKDKSQFVLNTLDINSFGAKSTIGVDDVNISNYQQFVILNNYVTNSNLIGVSKDVNTNYGYPYLDIFSEKVIVHKDVMLVPNYSALYYGINTNKNMTLCHNIDHQNLSTNTLLREKTLEWGSPTFTGTLNGNGKVIYNIPKSKSGTDYENALFNKLTFRTDSNGNAISANLSDFNFTIYYGVTDDINNAMKITNGDKLGILANTIQGRNGNNVLINNVNCLNTNVILNAKYVGGLVGTTEYATITNCTISSAFIIMSAETYDYNNVTSIAGGIVSIANNGTIITDCTVNAKLISPSGIDGKQATTYADKYGRGGDAGILGGIVGRNNGANNVYQKNNVSKCTLESGHGGNGADGKNSIDNGGQGKDGYAGGDVIIGAICGYDNSNGAIDNIYGKDNNSYNVTDGVKFIFSKDSGHNTIAGSGGQGGNGADGHGCSTPCYEGPWFDSGSCKRCTAGGNGGNGGNGGKAWIGYLYGKKLATNFATDKGHHSNLMCSLAGAGGIGGESGANVLKVDLFGVGIIQWWHYSNNKSKGGDAGKNGNNISGATGEFGEGDYDAGSMGSGGGSASSSNCYLQSVNPKS